ncbi:RDD family protein [Streptomyces sp. A0958]|uniref:RDD family protein n=1 Tax=Streptomyces sp. A0958 TaxID=2563101 RepID=UPI00109E7287|nr:RDD family protein [Streptomyces sp. A0958]THA72313.1 RDD family protein [Streptomyces sp. A0958]
MSAPTPAPGDESPREGYYPDPSIPGYVRYWNGASWVPGTSRPAPAQGETQGEARPAAAAGGTAQAPAPPPTPAPASVEETGPVFLDEEPYEAGRPEPATAWQADASRQAGFGGDHDRRVSWGGRGDEADADATADRDAGTGAGAGTGSAPGAASATPSAPSAELAPRGPASAEVARRAPAGGEPADRAPTDPRRPSAPSAPSALSAPSAPSAPEPAGGVVPGMREGGAPQPENTVAIRVNRPGRAGAPSGDTARPPAENTVALRPLRRPGGGQQPPGAGQRPPAEGTMTIRAIGAGIAPAADPQAPPAPTPPRQAAEPAARPSRQAGPGAGAGLSVRPAPAQPAFPQQGRPDEPVVPWKPPVDDHFQQLAAARTAGRPAPLGKRFAARLIDTVVLGALTGAASAPLVGRAADHVNDKIDAAKLSGETVTVWLLDSTTAALAGAVLGVFLVLGVLLEALPTAKWGRTLGKKLCGLDVRDIESHEAPGFGAALRRWLVYGVLGILVVGVADVLWCLIDRPWRQCWHDKAARTFVAG